MAPPKTDALIGTMLDGRVASQRWFSERNLPHLVLRGVGRERELTMFETSVQEKLRIDIRSIAGAVVSLVFLLVSGYLLVAR